MKKVIRFKFKDGPMDADPFEWACKLADQHRRFKETEAVEQYVEPIIREKAERDTRFIVSIETKAIRAKETEGARIEAIKAIKKKHAKPGLVKAINGCFKIKEDPRERVAEWAVAYNISEKTVYKKIAAIERERSAKA